MEIGAVDGGAWWGSQVSISILRLNYCERFGITLRSFEYYVWVGGRGGGPDKAELRAAPKHLIDMLVNLSKEHIHHKTS